MEEVMKTLLILTAMLLLGMARPIAAYADEDTSSEQGTQHLFEDFNGNGVSDAEEAMHGDDSTTPSELTEDHSDESTPES